MSFLKKQMFGWLLKLVFVLFGVIKSAVNYLSLILELYLIYTSALMFVSFYFFGEVSLNMTTEEYFKSEIFSTTLSTSCLMALMITMWRFLFFRSEKGGLGYQGFACATTHSLGAIYDSETKKSYVEDKK